jgi:hypothetical protein
VPPGRPRHLLGALFVASILGASAELLLVDHVEDFWQWLPLALMGLALAAWAWAALAPGPPSVRLFQTLMALLVASGALGLWLHYRANAEFELEMYPDLSGWALVWKAIQGASPPSLAPGTMFVIGGLGFVWAWTHPGPQRPSGDRS